ncbi:MAG: hypothetical protein PF636_06160 [Actinomycetota bacterium]|jgi:hypothetical protein|nr:hypothetical protein [Actinomycetota bacterium]
MNKILCAGLVVVALVGGFFGGTLWADRDSGNADTAAMPGAPAGFDREAMANMTQEERQAFIEESGGFPGGGTGGPAGAAGGMRGLGATVGTIIDVGTDNITVELDDDGGSMTVYYSDTTMFAQEGTSAADSLVDGAHVTLATRPASDGVFTADSVIVAAE